MRAVSWRAITSIARPATRVSNIRIPPRHVVRRPYSSVNAADLSFGQPVHETHPHILGPGELTPGITAQEYAARRTALAKQLPKDAIAVVAASDTVWRSGSVFYEFHQDPDFLYLTGFNEPEALAIIGKDSTGDDHTFHLYVREKDASAEQWDGARSGTQAAKDVFNADETGDISRLKHYLPDIVGGASAVYTDATQPDTNQSTLQRFLYGKSKKSTEFVEMVGSRKVNRLRPLMNNLRAFKSPAELEVMRKAGKASGRAHTDCMRKIWTRERQLDAFFRFRCVAHGCDTQSFEPVIGGWGKRFGHTLHQER